MVLLKGTEIPIKFSTKGSGLKGRLQFFFRITRPDGTVLYEKTSSKRTMYLKIEDMPDIEPGEYWYYAGVRELDSPQRIRQQGTTLRVMEPIGERI
jgi:hypothetical protein